MKGDPKVLQLLNRQLADELTAVNQYFLHARMYRHWGLVRLGKREYDESIEEMRHADRLIERILFLEGRPNMHNFHKLLVGESVPECLDGDLKAEYAARADLVDGVAYCEGARDFVSRDLLKGILAETEGHIDWLETQIALVGELGLQNYLQMQMEGAS
ncbi:MAG: bfr [Rhodocyclaceae bacterium]|nr:bfr [Rhodocyclaceae bacterium]